MWGKKVDWEGGGGELGNYFWVGWIILMTRCLDIIKGLESKFLKYLLIS